MTQLAAQMRRGFFPRILKTLAIVVAEPLAVALANLAPRAERYLRRLWQAFSVRWELPRWRVRRQEILRAGANRSPVSPADLGLEPDQLARLQQLLREGKEILLAEIDQDGFYCCHFGPMTALPTVSKAEYLPRRKYRLQLVARDGWVGVKKSFGGRRCAFFNELRALDVLGRAGCRVPAILDIDFDALSITTSLVLGDVLRERLAKASAQVRDRDLQHDSALQRLPWAKQFDLRVQSGARVVQRVVDASFIDELWRQLQLVHTAGIAWCDLKYGNIIVENDSGLPWLIDFERSLDGRRMNRYSFRTQRDADVDWFNRHFNQQQWTYRRIKQYLRSKDHPLRGPLYAPAYVGYGIWLGRILSVGAGIGRWDYILKDNLPSVRGKRVLDLGANNGFNAIQLLRNGAREVVAIERDELAIEQGKVLKEFYEWADGRILNLRFLAGNMAELPTMDLGHFDMAIALCSLYYLEREEMRRLTEYLSGITDVFVVQANHQTDCTRRCQDTYEKARIEFLQGLLQTNGFPSTQVISYPWYYRPLLVGRRLPHATAPGACGSHSTALVARAA